MNRPLNIRSELRRLMEYIGGNPMLLRLMRWTRAGGGSAGLARRTRHLRHDSTADRDLAAAQPVRPDLDPNYLTIILVGLVFFWLDNREHFGHRFGPKINDKDYLRQAMEILERGIRLPDCDSPDDEKPSATDDPRDGSREDLD